MSLIESIDDLGRLKSINRALMNRVESAMDQQGNAFSLFQTAINLESQVKRRTDELTATLRNLERTNIALSAAKEASEEADRSKTRFLAAASHDVLQPLNAAILSMSALADLQTTDQGRNLVMQVERSLETMNELLGTLLDISKLDAGVVRPTFGAVSVMAMFDSLMSDFAPIADQKGLRLRFLQTDCVVRSDKTMLRRILQNLISNGLRYTRSGGVVVGAITREDCVDIQVADTGCGIPEDQFHRVFEEFHRGRLPGGVEDGNPAGLGLGLSIVRRMVMALGHEIRFSSREGKGTRFHITAQRVGTSRRVGSGYSGAVAPASPPRGLSGRKVLLIENDTSVMEAMCSLLGSWGCQVMAANGGHEAADILHDTDATPDIIIADQQLDHGELGTNVVENILYYTGRTIPALIVTADPSEYVQRKVVQAGFDLMLKPVKPAQLRALMMHILQPSPV